MNQYQSYTIKDGKYKGEKIIEEYKWGVQQIRGNWQAALGYEHFPLVYVSWYGANEYAKWLTQQLGKTYGLPSKYYWEFAARGGSKSEVYKYAGDDFYGRVGWYFENSESRTHQIGELVPNNLGLYDMSGNVWEWCRNDDIINSNRQAACGGSWNIKSEYCKSFLGLDLDQRLIKDDIGFRVIHY